MIPGVVASCLPDLDVLGSFFTDPASNLYTHRGLTHSFFAITFFAFAGAYLTYKWIQSDIKLKKWWWMWILLLLSHILLDSLNNYGIGWWEPFSHQRISFDILYVADPLFSFWPAIVIMVIILYPAGRNFKYSLWIVGMSASFIYLSHCFINKKIIDHKVEAVLKQNGINHDSYLTTPAPFQNWLWFVVVKVKDVYYTGFASVFEGNEKLTFEKFDQNDSLLLQYSNHLEVLKLKTFARGYYTAEMWHDTLVFNDLRFGQIIGWQEPRQKFVFHYFLKPGADNKMVVQRGRLELWSPQVIRNYLKKIFGLP